METAAPPHEFHTQTQITSWCAHNWMTSNYFFILKSTMSITQPSQFFTFLSATWIGRAIPRTTVFFGTTRLVWWHQHPTVQRNPKHVLPIGTHTGCAWNARSNFGYFGVLFPSMPCAHTSELKFTYQKNMNVHSNNYQSDKN